MRVTTSKSKNSESFYITQSYTNAQGKSTSKTIRKLGTLAELSKRLNTDREGVMEWANEQARLETLKYKSEKEDAIVMIPFHVNKRLDYHKQKLFNGGYLFLQSVYYDLKMDSICRKIKSRYKFEYVMGMESGLFVYLSHPDLFLHRYPVFDDAARQVCRELCRAAKRLNMPLEYNLLGHKRQAEARRRGCIGYTSPEFWEIVAQEGGRAIIGVDAHDPAHLDCRDLYDQIRARLTGMGIEVLDVLENVEGK